MKLSKEFLLILFEIKADECPKSIPADLRLHFLSAKPMYTDLNNLVEFLRKMAPSPPPRQFFGNDSPNTEMWTPVHQGRYS